MNQFRRAILWAALIAIVLLTALSIYGAFVGADRAQAFFNSVPLAVYWFVLIALLAVGLIIFRRLLQIPALLLMHLGCILLLLGGVWGSKGGHVVQKRLFGIDKITRGELRLKIGDQTPKSQIHVEDGNSIRELPFAVRLTDFRIDYYPGDVFIQVPDEPIRRLPARPGERLALGEAGSLIVQKTFQNFKVRMEDDTRVVYDAPGGSNPAVELLLERPNRTSITGYVFEYFPPMFTEPVGFDLAYRRTIRDYISELEIIEGNTVVADKAIEVNHPLHYGGYHFYQHSLDEDDAGQYTILLVVSDSGLNLVYGGYVMLIAGVFWHFWGRRALIAVKTRRMMAPQTDQELPSTAVQQK